MQRMRAKMLDRKKVIKGLECCTKSPDTIELEDCRRCQYRDEKDCSCVVMQDALALLKEQEPVEPKKPISADDPFYECGNCGMPIASTMYQFCPYCGRKVDWNV